MVSKDMGIGFIAGSLLGYGILHPLVMLVSRAMTGAGTETHFGSAVLSAFHPAMLPWSLGFAVLCGVVGLMWVKINRSREQKLKLRAVLELAGATCHALNQPMQVVLGYAEMITKHRLTEDQVESSLKEIIEEIKRMDSLLKQIQNITVYETCEYVGGTRIVDIEKSTDKTGGQARYEIRCDGDRNRTS